MTKRDIIIATITCIITIIVMNALDIKCSSNKKTLFEEVHEYSGISKDEYNNNIEAQIYRNHSKHYSHNLEDAIIERSFIKAIGHKGCSFEEWSKLMRVSEYAPLVSLYGEDLDSINNCLFKIWNSEYYYDDYHISMTIKEWSEYEWK